MRLGEPTRLGEPGNEARRSLGTRLGEPGNEAR